MKTQDHAGDCGGSSYPRLSHPWCGEGWEWPRSCPEAQFACPGSWFGPYSACNCPLPPFSHGDIQIPLSTAYQHRCCSWLGGPIYSRVFPWLESLRTASPYSPSPVSPSDAPRPCDFQSQGAQEPTEDQGGPRAQLLWKKITCRWLPFGRGGTRAALQGGLAWAQERKDSNISGSLGGSGPKSQESNQKKTSK